MNKIILAGLLLAFPLLAISAKPPTVEQRLGRLERILQNQSLSDLVLQIQRLQQEVRKLRGDLEVQNHAMEDLKRRQRELYLDLDSRIARPAGTTPEVAAQADNGPAPVVDRSSIPAAAPPPPPPPPPVASVPGDPAKERAQYRKAFDLLQQGNYAESAQAFRGFLAAYPNGAYTDNAQYWLGEASYVTRDFDTAMQDFSKVLQQHPDSSKVPGAMLKMGYIHYEWRNWKKARDMLNRLMKQYSSTTEARLARQRLDRMRKEGR